MEIVIHVNMLKEGWDVNNLYTIVPLRTAASKILREQMVGRGLRLPYGERTGDRDVDAVMLTAHDKFKDILAEAQKGDSIFKAGNVIKAEEIKPEEVVYTQLTIETDPDAELEKAYAHTQIEKTDTTDALLKKATKLIPDRGREPYSAYPSSHGYSDAGTTNRRNGQAAGIRGQRPWSNVQRERNATGSMDALPDRGNAQSCREQIYSDSPYQGNGCRC